MGEVSREAELEAAADALLRAAGRDAAYPAYTEKMLCQKARRAAQRDLCRAAREGVGAGCLLESALAQLRRSEYEHMFKASGLTARESRVCRAVARGETLAQAGAALGVTPQAVHKALTRARAKIAARWRVAPYGGLWKLYAEDVQRALYVRRGGR